MGKRFHSKDYKTVKDLNTYRVEIWDTEFSGTSTEFSTGRDIFTLRYDGEFRKSPFHLQPSDVRFLFNVATSTHKQLVTDLNAAQEGRFQVKIFRNTNFYWCGNIVADLTTRPDLNTGLYYLEVEATDMIGALQNIDFNNDGDPYTGTATFLEIIHICLNKTGLLDFGWSGSDICIRTADNLYEDDMPTGAANDPLALARTRHRAFYNLDANGTYTYMSCYEVLESILLEKHLNLKLSNGSYRIYSFKELALSTLTHERRYDNTGSYLSAGSAIDITKTLDQDDSTAAKENIVDFTSYAPIKEVKIVYKTKNWTNYLAGAAWSNASGATFTANDLEIERNTFLTSLSLQLDVSGTTTNNGYDVGQPATVQVPLFAVFRLQLKIGDNYLKRDIASISNYTVTYGNTFWTTSSAHYYVAFYFQLPPDGETANFGPFSISEITPHLTDSGAFSAVFAFDSLRTPNAGAIVGGSNYSITWNANNGNLQILTDGNPLTDLADNTYTTTNDLASDFSDKLKFDVVIGDGTNANSQGRIEIYNGSTWEQSDAWHIGGAGATLPLLSAITRDILAMRATTVNRMEGAIYDTAGTMVPHSRVDDNSSDAIWLLVDGRYVARLERYSGTWMEIADSPDDLTTQDPVTVSPTPGTGGTGGTSTVPIPLPPPKLPVPPVPDLNGLISSGNTSTGIAVGSVTSIPTSQTLAGGAFQAGQVIALVDPSTGFSQNFTVTQTTSAGDTSIAVSGYAATNFPAGSTIILPAQNNSVQSFGISTPSVSSSENLNNWFSIFSQWWEIDNTLSVEHPIECLDVGFETDENAGDGATAGIRFDGDGLQSFDSSNTDPGVKIGTDGKFRLNNLETGTGTDGLIVEGGIVKKKTLSAGVTDHGALTGLADDDHTQYHNDARGDARYYTQTQLDAGQLDNRYFTESEHIDSSAGAGDAGKPVKLYAGGKIDATMIEDGDIDHGALTGLADDDHTQYHNDTRGDARYYTQTQLNAGQLDNRYYTESEHIDSSAGAGDAGKPVKLDAGGKIDATMIEDGDIDHGALTGLADDDHTQYVHLSGRTGGQTIIGGTGSGDDLTLESTSNATKGKIILTDDVEGKAAFDFRTELLTGTGSTAGVVVSNLGVRAWNNASTTPKVAIDDSGTYDLRSDPNVGNGSTAGVKISDTDGVVAYKSTSATPVFQLKPTGIFKLNHGSHPTIESDIFYVLDGVIYLDKDGAGTDVHPQYGHVKTFNVFGYSTAWTVGVANSVFFPITAEYAGLEIYKTGHGAGASQGTGAGSNIVKVYHFDGTTTTEINQLVINTGGNRTATDTTMTNSVTLSENDVIYFEVTQVSASTAAQGLTVDLYFQKA